MEGRSKPRYPAQVIKELHVNVLVVGGAGYIGSHTVVDLLEAGHEIAVFDNFENGSPVALGFAQPTLPPSPTLPRRLSSPNLIPKAEEYLAAALS